MANAATMDTVTHLLSGNGKPRGNATMLENFSMICWFGEGGHCELLAQHAVSAVRYVVNKELTIVQGLRRHLESDVFQVVLHACVSTWYLMVLDDL